MPFYLALAYLKGASAKAMYILVDEDILPSPDLICLKPFARKSISPQLAAEVCSALVSLSNIQQLCRYSLLVYYHV